MTEETSMEVVEDLNGTETTVTDAPVVGDEATKKKRVVVPMDPQLRLYYTAKTGILNSIKEENEETYLKLRKLALGNFGWVKYIADEDNVDHQIAEGILDGIFRKDYASKAIKTLFETEDGSGKELLAAHYTIPPTVCPVCKKEPTVLDDGTVRCTTAKRNDGTPCPMSNEAIPAYGDIDLWNIAMNPIKKD